MLRRKGRGWLLGLAVLLHGELEPSASVEVQPQRVEALRVEVVGCSLRAGERACVRPRSGPPTRCELMSTLGEPRGAALRLRVSGDALEGVRVAWDGRPADLRPVAFEGGLEWTLPVPEGARVLSLHVGDELRPRWTLTLVDADESAIVRAARATPRAGDEPTWGELEDGWSRLDALDRVVALELLIEHALEQAARESEHEARMAAHRRALSFSEEVFSWLGRLGDPVRANCNARRALFTALEYLHDAEATERWRRRLRASSGAWASTRVGNDYYEGLVAQRMGELQSAVEAHARVEAGARRAEDDPYLLASLPQRAVVLASLRRTSEALDVLERARDHADGARCRDRLRVLNSVAWARLLLAEQGVSAGDPVPELDEVRMMLEGREDPEDPCVDATLETLVGINLAIAALDEGRLGQAQVELDRLPPTGPGTEVRAWSELLELRLRLGEGEPVALAEWMMAHAELGLESLPPDQRWRRAYWHGRAYERLGLVDEATGAYEAAERALEQRVRRLDFDTAREGLLLGHQRSAQRLVELLVSRGRVEEALCVARRARRRMDVLLDRTTLLSSLDEPRRERWREAISRVRALRERLDRHEQRGWMIPGDEVGAHRAEQVALREQLDRAAREAFVTLHGSRGVAAAPEDPSASDGCEALRVPEEGALHLLYFPLGSLRGSFEDSPWMAFGFDSRGVVATARLPRLPSSPTPEAWAEVLLPPFEAALAKAEHVEVLPVGPLWSVPFAALPWGDDVLLAHAPVVSSLDLMRRRTDEPAPREPLRRALVIGAPQGDLRAAEREASMVAASLEARGWSVRSLRGEQATAEAVRRGLAEVTLLHYAGHGHRGGVEGWASRLPLAGGGELDVRDVLTLPRVPELALLPACDTTPGADATLGGGMSMARALLLAGVDLVVASDGQLDDGLAERLARHLYVQGVPDRRRGPRALQRALLAVRDEAPAGAAWWRIQVMRP